MLRILGKAASINVRKVLWTCAELDLPYALEEWGGGHRPTDTPEFLALNPNAMVPVLHDGELVLWESNTICRYLAGRYGDGALLPAEPGGRSPLYPGRCRAGSLAEPLGHDTDGSAGAGALARTLAGAAGLPRARRQRHALNVRALSMAGTLALTPAASGPA